MTPERLRSGEAGRITVASDQPATGHAGISTLLTLLFAVSGGVAVANLYWAQPLLGRIAGEFGTGVSSAGIIVTVTQIGYAAGVSLLVPLGDTIDRRRMIPAMMLCAAVALATAGCAPNFTALLASLVAVGVSTVTGQLLTPLAGDLARPDQRGRVVGTVVSGLLTGILLSRTISGVVGDLFGWRIMYWIAAVASALIAALLAALLPRDVARPRVRYPALLWSVIIAVRQHRAIPVTLVLGALGFGTFSMFWTALTFLLSAPPYSYPTSTIGLVGLVGLAGALAAQRSGSLHDRGWSVRATGFALLLAVTSLVLAWIFARSIAGMLFAVLLLDIAIQALNVLNQTRVLSVNPAARSRLNTALITSNFIGGAIGSALAGILWAHGGWPTVMFGGCTMTVTAWLIWAGFHRRLEI